MRNDAKEAAQDEFGEGVRLLGSDDSLEPAAVLDMSVCVLPVSVDQDVDVREDQSSPSIRSSRAALSSRSTPG